ncbi:MAG: ankyrin repeat domain-containing protein [Xenococcaceae cyanobacterium]
MNNLDCKNYELIDAIIAKNLSKIKVLISQRVDVNQCDLSDDFTPLMRAVDLDLVETIELLLKAGANVNLSPSPDDTALGLAISNGNLEVVKLLLNAGANPDRGGCVDPLISAVSRGDINMVLVLLEEGANTSSNFTPLMVAASKGDLGMVQFLVDIRENVNKTDEYGETALAKAASNGHEEVFEYLLPLTNSKTQREYAQKKLASALIRHRNLSKRLFLNILRNDFQGIRKAIKDGVKVDKKNDEGLIPIIVAANAGNIEAVRLLIKAGANVNAKDNNENTVLSLVKQAGHHEIIQLLVEAGATEN